MNKIYKVLSAVITALVLSTAVAAADTNTSVCSIFDTGTDSFNKCQTNVDNNVTISCKNDIYVVNNNEQNSSTGPAVVTDNSSSGNATSGDATNNNGTAQNIGASCAPITTASTTPTVNQTNQTPQTTAAVATTKTTPKATTKTPVVSLPETGNNSANNTASTIGISAAGLSVVSLLGLGLYRRLVLR